MIAMEIHHLSVKIDGFPIISDLNLMINEGENISILSDSRGKGVILRTLCGFELPGSGEIWAYNLPPRQAFLRAIIHPKVQSSSDFQPFLIIVNPRTNYTKLAKGVVIQIIEIFNKIIQKNYKLTEFTEGGMK